MFSCKKEEIKKATETDKQILSSNFKLSEFEKSQAATRLHIKNKANDEQVEALRALCVNVLEPIRQHFDSALIVNSGFRSLKLNRVIGGSVNSQHSKGQAADFTIQGVPNITAARWIRDNIDYDQLIFEGHWLHVSYDASKHKQRKSTLTAHFNHKKVIYTQGIA